MTFSNLNLHASLVASLPSSLLTPTKIQRLAIPAVLAGGDVLALAQTGSGKTLAFGLPLLQRVEPNLLDIQSVILVPTRELAVQVSQDLSSIALKMGIRLCTLCGGVDQNEQLNALAKLPHLLVATPGRLLDLLKQQHVSLESVQQLVLDEADRLLDMGFWPDVQRIVQLMPSERQTLLFSATFSDALSGLTQGLLSNPIRIEANETNHVVDEIEERIFLVNKGSKSQALIALLKEHVGQQVLVFISAKDNADTLSKKLLKAGIKAAALHGDKDQTVRMQTLADFKANKIDVLVATDLLARGIHIDALPIVINFDLPTSAPVYVHRIGRTARAGQHGLAISLTCHGETEALQAIRQLTQRELPQHELAGFTVTDQPTTGASKRKPRDKQANRRSAQKRSIKQFQKKTADKKK
ncbi:DEAD/DEAH box helicase [Vibrio aestuarianus]|uniref:DEAD/DEAH box helicase n=1 Tax=Vibrio aestuarianus TaxID=28171 RepID=UPI00237C6B27|nr:DEAD/DEAH box helicase [Vibrio aestuarianus]MDE1351423.1 DEAD/DEAH box helicase [Vibrio aestuarianus]